MSLEYDMVLAGSVRRASGRLRIAAQLIDAPTGIHIWAERYDRDFADIFAVQDEITKAVAAAIGPAIVEAERSRAVRKPPENLGAWEAYQRGLWHMAKHETSENEVARSLFERAIALDPSFAAAYSAIALTYSMAATVFSSITIAEGCSLAEQFARKAIGLDENDAEARARLALALFIKGDNEGAIQEAEYALSINDNCADAFGVKGGALIFSRRGEQGREALRHFLLASPRDPTRPVRLSQIAASYYLEGNYERAEEAARQVVRRYPNSPQGYRWLAASLGQLGRTAEATEALSTLTTMAPASIDQAIRHRMPMFRVADYNHMLEGLRKAGWQE